MAEIINLRQARKRREKEAQRRLADESSAKHGRSAAERALEALRQGAADRKLDGAKLDGAKPGGPGREAPRQEADPETSKGEKDDA